MDDLYDNYLGRHLEGKARPSAGYTAFREAKFAHNYLDLLLAQRGGTLVEIGPGMGEFQRWAREHASFARVCGVDYAPDCVAFCRAEGFDVEQIDDAVAWLRARPGELAAVVMLHVLEHIAKPEGLETLRAIRAALRPGGVLIAEVPNAGNPWLSGIARYEDYTHQTGYTDNSLRFAMELAGFADVTVAGVKVPWRSKYLPVRAASTVGNALTMAMTKLVAPRADHLLDAQIFAAARV